MRNEHLSMNLRRLNQLFGDSIPAFDRHILIHDSADLIEDVELLEQTIQKVIDGKELALSDGQKLTLAKLSHAVSVIYFCAAPECGLIKVGVTRDIKKRLNSLKTMSPSPIELIATLRYHEQLERRIHAYLDDYRSHGEWFHADKPVLDFVRLARDKGIRPIVEIIYN